MPPQHETTAAASDAKRNDRLPLRDCVVLDFSDEALAEGGRLLASLGADVIRVEPVAGDPLRHTPPFLDGHPGEERALPHMLFNAGKRSLALALETPEAWDVIERMLPAADVLIAPLEKGDLARQFFDPVRLAALYPRLGLVDVICRRGEPHFAATDLIASAAGGLLYCSGFPDRAPDYPAGNLAYKQGSFLACALATVLCLNRRLTGLGGQVCISLQEAVASTTVLASNENHWLWRGLRSNRSRAAGLAYPEPDPDEDMVASIAESSTIFRAKDGRWVVFGFTPYTADRWKTFARWYEQLTGSGLLHDEKWDDAMQRIEQRRELNRAITHFCSLLTRDELATRGQALGLMILPVNSVADLPEDPQLKDRNCFPLVEQPGVGRVLPHIRHPFRSSAFDAPPRGAPVRGEHSFDVLTELAGMDPGEVHDLSRRGVVFMPGFPPGAARAVSSGPGKAPAAPVVTTHTRQLPLEGYRVVDFCWMAAGPLVTEMLANLGADVIKIESLARMDTLREYHHPPQKASIDTGALFQDCNTGKRSVTLNLGTADGIALARQLVRTADVVTSNFTPGQMERWGLGSDELRRDHQRLIVATFPVMGSSGPRAHWRSIGTGVGAIAGLSWHTGQPDRPPIGLGTLQPDFTMAPLGAALIVAALLERERSGRGQHLEVAQYEAAIQLIDGELFEYLVNGVERPRMGNRSTRYAPHGVFPCAGEDRWVAIAVRGTSEWQALARLMGNPGLATRRDLQALPGRKAAEDEIEAALTEWTQQFDPWSVTAALQKSGIPASPLEHIGDLVDGDPATKGFFAPFTHPAGVEFLVQHQPFTWAGERLPIARAPLIGEHNEEVFRGLAGVGEERLIELMVDHVIY